MLSTPPAPGRAPFLDKTRAPSGSGVRLPTVLVRVARAALFLVTMLVASTLSRSAFASGFTGYFGAPFCDDRGATGLAARPDVQAPDAVLQQARSKACDLPGMAGMADAWRALLSPGGPAKIVAMADDSAPVHPVTALAMPPAHSFDLVVIEVAGHPSPGEHARIERPPRA